MNHKIMQLRELLSRKESEKKPYETISSGCQPLDRLLPQCGFQRGSLIEWIAGGAGSGASLLALLAARAACGRGGTLVLVDRRQRLYPPAAKACQLELQNTIVVHPASAKDECWAVEQTLRCPDIAAVVAWPERLTSHAFRRLQLAAEHGGGMGLLVRPATACHESSWASVRMMVTPCATSSYVWRQGWRLGIELLRCGGLFGTKPLELEIDYQTGELRDAHPRSLAAQLAGTTPDPRQARA